MTSSFLLKSVSTFFVMLLLCPCAHAGEIIETHDGTTVQKDGTAISRDLVYSGTPGLYWRRERIWYNGPRGRQWKWVWRKIWQSNEEIVTATRQTAPSGPALPGTAYALLGPHPTSAISVQTQQLLAAQQQQKIVEWFKSLRLEEERMRLRRNDDFVSWEQRDHPYEPWDGLQYNYGDQQRRDWERDHRDLHDWYVEPQSPERRFASNVDVPASNQLISDQSQQGTPVAEQAQPAFLRQDTRGNRGSALNAFPEQQQTESGSAF